ALRISLLAIALSVFSSISSFAQLPSYNDMDALFGFNVTSGTGTAFCGVIDLGPVSQFNHTFTLSLGNIGSYIAAPSGIACFTRIDPVTLGTSVQWGVWRRTTSPISRTIFGRRAIRQFARSHGRAISTKPSDRPILTAQAIPIPAMSLRL